MRINEWQAVSFLTVVSFLAVALEIPSATWPTTAALSLACGVAALATMAAAAILGSRWRFVESLFGGLDRVYSAHKWFGIAALVFASVHLVFKAGMTGWQTAAILPLPGDITRLVRQLSFVALMFIVMLALNRKIRYSLWRWWHKLSGPLFVIAILHWLSFKSPIALNSPAGVWLAALSALGVAAAAYKLLLYPWLANQAEYRVAALSAGAAAVQLTMLPVRQAIAFEPGQFAFLLMKEDGLREPHPFTIASSPSADGRVDFVIRALGDYTRTLVDRCTVGMHADIYGPFGRFARPPAAKREVWIGGGVGISPFIAWLADASIGRFEAVTLFYFYTPGRAFPDVDELAQQARERGIELVPVAKGPTDPAFVRRFAELARLAGPTDTDISFCGPVGLLKQVRAEMAVNGIPMANLRSEYFEFR